MDSPVSNQDFIKKYILSKFDIAKPESVQFGEEIDHPEEDGGLTVVTIDNQQYVLAYDAFNRFKADEPKTWIVDYLASYTRFDLNKLPYKSLEAVRTKQPVSLDGNRGMSSHVLELSHDELHEAMQEYVDPNNYHAELTKRKKFKYLGLPYVYSFMLLKQG